MGKEGTEGLYLGILVHIISVKLFSLTTVCHPKHKPSSSTASASSPDLSHNYILSGVPEEFLCASVTSGSVGGSSEYYTAGITDGPELCLFI